MAQSTFRSQKCNKLTGSDHFWKLRCPKSARRCGAKHISKSKCTKHTMSGPLLEIEMSKKCTPLWREGQNVKNTRGSDHFWTFRCRFAWQAQGIVHLLKSEQNVGLVAFPKTMAGVGHLKRICKDAFSLAGTVQETCLSEMLGGPGADFLREVAFLEHQIFRFAEMILRDRCSTSYDLASMFCGRRSTLDWWSGKIAKRMGTRPSALHSTFYF